MNTFKVKGKVVQLQFGLVVVLSITLLLIITDVLDLVCLIFFSLPVFYHKFEFMSCKENRLID